MVSIVNKSGNDDIDALLWGYKWDDTSFEFSFPQDDFQYVGYPEITEFQGFTETQKNATRDLIGYIRSYTGLSFTETANVSADFRFAEAVAINYTNDPTQAKQTGYREVKPAQAGPPELAYNGSPPEVPTWAQGDAWFNRTAYNDLRLGSFVHSSGLMHETGHLFGLKHGHAAQSGHGITFPELPADHDSFEYSVMTYNQYVGDPDTFFDNAVDHPTTFMQNDIAALQYLYGANFTTGANGSNTVYSWSTTTGEMFLDGFGTGAPTGAPGGNLILRTIWDGGGTDTYDFSNYSTNLTVDLAPGNWTSTGLQDQLANLGTVDTPHYARGNIANALLYNGDTRSLIENAYGGAGHDYIYGNQAENDLRGNGGVDTLYGFADDDTLYGNQGGDFLKGGGGDDRLYGGTEADTLYGEDDDDRLFGEDGGDRLFGEDGNDTLRGGAGADSLSGGSGTDLAWYLDSSTGVTVYLQTPSENGRGYFGDAQGDTLTSIENLTGSYFDDYLVGNAGANVLDGGAGDGDDVLIGGGGGDTLRGGLGSDTVRYGASAAGVVVTLANGTGGGGDATGDTYVSIENVAGSEFADLFLLSAAANDIDGFNGLDTVSYAYSTSSVYIDLDDGTGGGRGYAGYAEGDTYYNVENATGSSHSDELTGTGSINTLDGGNGDDAIDGMAGADRLLGGAGSDTYYVDNAGDQVIEAAGGGTGDRIYTSVSYVLRAGQEVETIGIVGSAGTVAGIKLTGNEKVQRLDGSNLANTLDGKVGADTMAGYGGNDTYFVDNAGDRVLEAVGGGTADRVITSTSYTLEAGQEVETLSTASSTATTAMSLTGNDKVQTLLGNAGINSLDGKAGADTMVGYGGNDTYTVDNAGDRALEAASGGTADRVLAGVSYALGAGQEIETLATTNAGATTAMSLTGNDKAQTITGNNGANVLDGKAGADILRGNGGADSFAFSTALGTSNVDHIVDFSPAADTIQLSRSIFSALGTGALDADAFKKLGVAGASVDADDRILYNANTGALSYDADGSGTTRAAVQFAILDNKAGLTFQDFLVV